MRSTTTLISHSNRQHQRSGWLGSINLKRRVVLAVLGVLLALTGAAGCSRSTPEPGGATTTKAKTARKAAETYALEAVQGAVAAEVESKPELAKPKSVWGRASELVIRPQKPTQTVTVSTTITPTPPTPPVPPMPPMPTLQSLPPPTHRPVPRPSGTVVIREKVTSEIPYPTEVEAEAATLEQCVEVIARKLHALGTPIEYRPSVSVIKNDYLRPESRVVRPPTPEEKELIKRSGYHTDRVYVEYTVELTTDQIRELRAHDRLGAALRVFGVIAATALAGFGFLRLDQWSKGYLTSWLAFIALGLAGGAGLALLFV